MSPKCLALLEKAIEISALITFVRMESTVAGILFNTLHVFSGSSVKAFC